MQSKTKTRLRLAANSLFKAFFGAWLLASYVRLFHPGESPFVEEFQWVGFLVWYPLMLLGSEPSNWKPSSPSPERSVWGLCLAIGGGAAIFLLKDYSSIHDLFLPAAIMTLAVILGATLGRFTRLHANEIGEARFGSDGKPLGPWKPPA